MFDRINQYGTAVFERLDQFGHNHWGFILAVVFIWLVLDKLIKGIRSDVRWTQRQLDWQRNRRTANRLPARMKPAPTRPVDNSNLSPSERPWLDQPSGTIQKLGEVALVGSSQAGLGSFHSGRNDFAGPSSLEEEEE